MYEDDEDRINTAEPLAENNLSAAAEAFTAIAGDATVADEVRLSAAEQLAPVDPAAAAPGLAGHRPRPGGRRGGTALRRRATRDAYLERLTPGRR